MSMSIVCAKMAEQSLMSAAIQLKMWTSQLVTQVWVKEGAMRSQNAATFPRTKALAQS